MSDKLQKFLAKLNNKDFQLSQALIKQVLDRDFDNLDIKPLRGHKDCYRVRKGRLKLIFCMKSHKVIIYQISNRDEQTY